MRGGLPARWLLVALLCWAFVLAPAPAAVITGADGAALAAEPRPKPAPRKKRRPRRKQKKKPAKRPTAAPAATSQPAADPEVVLQRSNRMEFDARLVRGETPRSGAVYLFQRAPRRLPPLVTLRQSYLDDVIHPVLGPVSARPARAATPKAATP